MSDSGQGGGVGLKRLILIAALALPLCGCELQVRPGAESILDAMNDEIPPGELAAMAIDRYDANNRYRGTLGLSSAYFASEPVYIRLFEDNIRDPDPAVRAAAARGLANHGEPRHVPLLAEALRDSSKMVRLEAAKGLQRLHDDSAVRPLIAAVREPDLRDARSVGELDAEVRAEAADALGQYADLLVLHALIAALDDADLAVNRRALKSLRTLTGQDFGIDRAAWADWLKSAETPFAGQQIYTYPVFNRRLRMYEYVPFVRKPMNEVPGPPAGVPR